MLVLSRRANEAIMIGDGVEVKVLRIDGDLVKIGINAPREIPILRKEVHVEQAANNRRAVITSPSTATLPALASLARPKK